MARGGRHPTGGSHSSARQEGRARVLARESEGEEAGRSSARDLAWVGPRRRKGGEEVASWAEREETDQLGPKLRKEGECGKIPFFVS